MSVSASFAIASPLSPGSPSDLRGTGVTLLSGTVTAWTERANAEEIVEWALARFGRRLCLATSFTDTVLVDVALGVDPDIPVFFADTGFHFAETLATMREAQVRFRLDLRVVRPEPAATSLWSDGAEACCGARKVAPLLRAMSDQGFSAWLSGLRRAESAARAGTPVVSGAANGLTRIAPLANWSDADVDHRIVDRNLPVNPLVEQGYPSIGCWPCTEPAVGSDTRSGRWTGSEKTECGLHGNYVAGRPSGAVGEGRP